MLIIRKLNCTDAASGIVTLKSVAVRFTGSERTHEIILNLCTGRPLTESDDTRCCISTIKPRDDEHVMLETCRGL